MTELLPENVKGGFWFNHKIIIIGFMNRHLILWSLKNLMIYDSLGKETSCARKRRITPRAPYLK
jgi:hypothetical protein